MSARFVKMRQNADWKVPAMPSRKEAGHEPPDAAAIYRYCRPPGGHHITLTNELMIETDRHWQGYLLGSDCENDLNKGGETWPMPLLASYQGTFPRREIWTFVLMRSRIS